MKLGLIMEDSSRPAQANASCLSDLCSLRLAQSTNNNNFEERPTTRMMNLRSNSSSNNNNNRRCRCIKEINHNTNRSHEVISLGIPSKAKEREREKKYPSRLIQISQYPLSSGLKHKRHKERRKQLMEAVPIIISLPKFCYLSSLLAIWFLMLNCICRTPAIVESARLPDIYWNSSNPM